MDIRSAQKLARQNKVAKLGSRPGSDRHPGHPGKGSLPPGTAAATTRVSSGVVPVSHFVFGPRREP